MVEPLFKFRSLARELDVLIKCPVVPHVTGSMMTLGSSFILKDEAYSLSEDEIWDTNIQPVLESIATLCNGCSKVTCRVPGFSDESGYTDRYNVGFKQNLYIGGRIPVLLRMEYDINSAGTKLTISTIIGPEI